MDLNIDFSKMFGKFEELFDRYLDKCIQQIRDDKETVKICFESFTNSDGIQDTPKSFYTEVSLSPNVGDILVGLELERESKHDRIITFSDVKVLQVKREYGESTVGNYQTLYSVTLVVEKA